jgi:hypothetical protein
MENLLRTETISITMAMLRTIAEIDEFKGAWTELDPNGWTGNVT